MAPVEQHREFLTIQALRFFAALGVVVLHSSFYTAERLDSKIGLWDLGANGVRLFFVISGFVMIVANTSGGWSIFAIKRIIRIVPMYWAATGLKLLIMIAAPAVVLHAIMNWSYLAKSLFFIPAINVDGEIRPLLGVGWTLTFEMFFYALFAIALMFRRDPLHCLAPVLIALAFLSHFRTPAWPVPLRCWANPIVLDFLAGMLLGRWCQKNPRVAPSVSMAIMMTGLVYLFVPLGSVRPPYDSILGSCLTSLAALCVVAGAVLLEPLLRSHIPRFVLFMGAASYAIYLIHPLVGPIIPTTLSKAGLIWPHLSVLVSVCLAVTAGALGHILIERPATRSLTIKAKRMNLLDGATPSRDRADSGSDQSRIIAGGGAPRP